jgi:alpha-amylase/alpha-mannosidase (GH57 family)
MTRRALCIHGHFYQPSREDPLTGLIPQESGAEPFKNWNEKINARCYLPNASIGNFEKISFNLGPTLTRWMEVNAEGTLKLIAWDEQKNAALWNTGNALAQPYHHTILPLASRLDKITQVRWGIADYEHTFGHPPEGMWLPETAVDLETLSVLAENSIKFTILAPWQAGEEIDVTQPYRVDLPGGNSICVFFFHKGLSTCISFDADSTMNADAFIQNCLKPAYTAKQEDQLILIATDGELYGHHQPFRDKFLNYLLNGTLDQVEIEYTTPGRWLKDHPPVKTIQIRERTSWSCEDGLLRWQDQCSCTPHGTWKRSLRDFMDKVAGLADEQYLRITSPWLKDRWQARDEYIHVLFGDESFLDWEMAQALRPLSAPEEQSLARLLTGQFERQRMYTSCGWFFEDFDRIEPCNNIRYAAHALVLTESVCGEELIAGVKGDLKQIRSWRSSLNAEEVFDEAIRRFEENV